MGGRSRAAKDGAAPKEVSVNVNQQTDGAGADDAGQDGHENFSIAELAREFNVTARAIRFYEDKGLITPMRQGTRRIYSPRDRVRLRLILRGRRLGLSLDDIREIIDLYDTDAGHTGQLRLLIAKIEDRRRILLTQRQDIDAMLEGLDQVHAQCMDILISGKAS